jgi:hypothetical protein
MQINNEPVAWMSQGGDVTRSKDYFKEMGFKDLIPLYTHPEKTELPTMEDEYWLMVEVLRAKVKEQQAEIEALKAEKIRAYDNGYEDGRKPDTNPKLAKILTADEITLLVDKIVNPDGCDIFTLIRAVEEAHGIRKAQEK